MPPSGPSVEWRTSPWALTDSRKIQLKTDLPKGGKMKTAHFSICILIGLLLSATALAQTATTARLSGRVTDAQGAVIIGANVELTDAATGAKRTTITNDEGSYVFASLVPGTYNMTVTKTGFKLKTVSAVNAQVSKSLDLDVGLETGGSAEQITVAAG